MRSSRNIAVCCDGRGEGGYSNLVSIYRSFARDEGQVSYFDPYRMNVVRLVQRPNSTPDADNRRGLAAAGWPLSEGVKDA